MGEGAGVETGAKVTPVTTPVSLLGGIIPQFVIYCIIMKKAIIYCRVSSQAQADEGTSLASQNEACIAHATSLGYEIVGSMQEVFSGAYFHERPLLREMREGIRKGSYDAVIFYAIDRLSRNVAHLCIIADECLRYNVELVCVTEDFDQSAEGTLMRSVKGYMAEIEREKISERTLRGRRSKAESGKLICGIPIYGYTFNKETGCREIVEHEAEVVKEIYRRFLAGQSTYKIQNYLNEADVPTPSRRSTYWHHTGVLRILTSEIYYGASHSFKWKKTTKTIKGRRTVSVTPRDKNEWIELPEGITPPIIDKATFDAAQIVRGSNKKHLRQSTGEYLMRQRIVCGICGSNLRGETSGKDWKAYRCVPRVPQLRCGNPSLKAEKIEPVVWGKLVEIIESPDAVASMRERYTARDGSKQTLIDEVKRLNREIGKVDGAISLITQRAGTAPDDVWSVLQVELGKQQQILNGLREQRDSKNQAIRMWDEQDLDFERLGEYIEVIRPLLAQMQFQERRRVIDAFDAKAIWNKGAVSISISVIPSYSQTKLELV